MELKFAKGDTTIKHRGLWALVPSALRSSCYRKQSWLHCLLLQTSWAKGRRRQKEVLSDRRAERIVPAQLWAAMCQRTCLQWLKPHHPAPH